MGITASTPGLVDDEPAKALRGLFDSRYGQLVALAETMLRDHAEAEDVVQDAFASALRNRSALCSDVAGYVVQSVVNGARSRLRRRAVERRPRPLGHDSRGGSETDGSRWGGELFELVSRLPRRQAQVVFCRYTLDLTLEQTADVLGISRRAVRTHADRAMQKLQQWIEEDSV